MNEEGGTEWTSITQRLIPTSNMTSVDGNRDSRTEAAHVLQYSVGVVLAIKRYDCVYLPPKG